MGRASQGDCAVEAVIIIELTAPPVHHDRHLVKQLQCHWKRVDFKSMRVLRLAAERRTVQGWHAGAQAVGYLQRESPRLPVPLGLQLDSGPGK